MIKPKKRLIVFFWRKTFSGKKTIVSKFGWSNTSKSHWFYATKEYFGTYTPVGYDEEGHLEAKYPSGLWVFRLPSLHSGNPNTPRP